jgi:hypothetical protein
MTEPIIGRSSVVSEKEKIGEQGTRYILTPCTISFKTRFLVKPKIVSNRFKVTLLFTVSVFFHFIIPVLNLADIVWILSNVKNILLWLEQTER